MIKCNACKSISQDVLIVHEIHYECPGWPVEAVPVCPVCHDTDVEKFEGNDLCD